MRSFFVASGFVAASAVVVACVGGGGSLPSEVVGGEGTSTSAGSGARQDDSAPQAPPSANGNSGQGATEPQSCTPGAPCDCGSASFVGTQKCDGDKPTCECKPAPRPDAG